MNTKEMIDMEIGSRREITTRGPIAEKWGIVRVPGGWIYSMDRPNTEEASVAVFVPEPPINIISQINQSGDVWPAPEGTDASKGTISIPDDAYGESEVAEISREQALRAMAGTIAARHFLVGTERHGSTVVRLMVAPLTAERLYQLGSVECPCVKKEQMTPCSACSGIGLVVKS